VPVDAGGGARRRGIGCPLCPRVHHVVPRGLPVKGHDQVIQLLNDVLTAELTAINQYWIHARMCENWGYVRLWEKIRAESLGEMKHADRLLQPLLLLHASP